MGKDDAGERDSVKQIRANMLHVVAALVHLSVSVSRVCHSYLGSFVRK